MSSRKSSRRSSSSVRTSAKDDSNAEINTIANNTIQNMTQQIMIIGFVISVIVQGSILYYLYNLEDADCNCIRDWRHNFCKAYALLVLGVGVVLLGLGHLCKGFMIIYYILGLVNVYAFFTYIGDLNSTQCTCAVNKQPKLNYIMRVYRWLEIFAGIAAIMQLLSMLGIGASKIAPTG